MTRFGVARWVAAGLGAGFSPVAPGTAGSVVALLAGVWALTGPWWVLAAMAVAATGVGLAVVPLVVRDPDADPGWVVIDEVAGQWIALLGLSVVSWVGVVAAFGLFRLFDIWKPGLIGWADRRPGAVGIMLDDVLAGVAAAAVLLAARAAGVEGL